MKKTFILSILLISIIIKSNSIKLQIDSFDLNDSNDATDVVKALVKRRFPKLMETFVFEIISKVEDKDIYEIESRMESESKVYIRGNNAVSMSSALGKYMRYHAHTQLTWTGDQLINAEPSLLPKKDFKARVLSPLKYSYYLNTCTHSYSSVWWDWERWEKEIDWMALNGINFPLAFVGQEYIWYKLFQNYGLNDTEIKAWISGPAFLAWFRMGNMAGWGGPISDEFLENQVDLQKKILKRMRQFSMIPILPMFTGFVPYAFTLKHPGVKFREGVSWSGFYEREYHNWNLDAAEPLFTELGQKFIEIQNSVYGSDHFYNGDMFNEMAPISRDPEYLKQAGKGTIDGLMKGDPDAIWVMQGWLFANEKYFWGKKEVKAYLSEVPNDRMIILDLYTEAKPVWRDHENYYGKNWIWCALINFGGNPPLRGEVKYLLSQPYKDLMSPGSKMIGVGITMEGIDNNYLVYESILEAKWRNDPPNVDWWIDEYVHSRYGDQGFEINNVKEAWKLFHKNIWDQFGTNGSVVESRPNFNGLKEENDDEIYYLNLKGTLDQMAKGWGLFVSEEVSSKLLPIQTYITDIVDIGQYCLESLFNMVRVDFFKAYKSKDQSQIDSIGSKMRNIINDLDRLSGCANHTLMGKWIEDARKMVSTDKEKNIIEWNARLQVTTWHTGVNNVLNDYAKKAWNGLYGDYYYKRWDLFINEVKSCVEQGKNFNQGDFDRKVFKIEDDYVHSLNKYISVAEGNAAEIGREIYNKYFK